MLQQIINKLQTDFNNFISNIIEIQLEDRHTRKEVNKAFQCEISILDKTIILEVGITEKFPCEAPKIYLKDKNSYGFIPHIESDGSICYMEDEGILLDQDNPVGIIVECIQKASNTIQNGITGENIKDFYNEFEAFWRRICRKELISLVETEDTVKTIFVWELDSDGFLLAADDITQANLYSIVTLHSNISEKPHFTGIFIPLKDTARILPPQDSNQWNIKVLRNLINTNITGSNQNKLQAKLKNRKLESTSKEYIIISIPKPDGYKNLIGFELLGFKPNKNINKKTKDYRHPLIQIECSFNMNYLRISRHNKQHLLERTSGYKSLKEKNIAIVGVGAIGGRLVLELIRAGVNKLTIIDNDYIDIDNIYRHELGAWRLYELNDDKKLKKNYKVNALKQEIDFKYPFVEVIPLVKDVRV